MDTVRYGLCSVTIPWDRNTFELPADAVIVQTGPSTGLGLQIIYVLPGVPEYWPWNDAESREQDKTFR